MIKRCNPSLYRAAICLTILLILSFTGLSANAASGDIEVGVAAAVKPNVTSTLFNTKVRTLKTGAEIFHDERISTSQGGTAFLLFTDRSSLTVGPNSDVVLDDFVFDPDQGTGRIVIGALKGALRLVGGRISKRTPVLIQTPTATVGIRGGIALVNIADSGRMKAAFVFGRELVVTSAGVTQRITRPGFVVDVAPNAPPAPPRRASEAELQDLRGALESKSDDSGQGSPGQNEGDGETQQADAAAGDQEQTGDDTPGNRQSALADDSRTGFGNSDDDRGGSGLSVVQGILPVPGGIDNKPVTPLVRVQPIGSGIGPVPVPLPDPTLPSSNITVDGDFSGRIAFYDSNKSNEIHQFLDDGKITNNVFRSDASFGEFEAPITFDFSNVSVRLHPFLKTDNLIGKVGSLSADGGLTSTLDFLGYALVEAGTGRRGYAFAGIPSTTLPTSGVSSLAMYDDMVQRSFTPFLPFSHGGAIRPLQNEESFDGAIIWNISDSSTAQRAFGHLSFAVNPDTNVDQLASEAVSLMVGSIELDAQGRPFLSGHMRGSAKMDLNSSHGIPSVTSGHQHPMFFTSDVGSLADGHGNHFFGRSGPGFSMLGSAHLGSDGKPIGTTTAQTKFGTDTISQFFPASPLIGSTPTQRDTNRSFTRTLNGYTGGAFERYPDGKAVFFQNENDDPNEVRIKTSAATNKMQAIIDIHSTDGNGTRYSHDFGDGDINAFQSATNTSGHSFYGDDNSMAAVESEFSTPVSGNTSGETISGAGLYMVSFFEDSIRKILDENQDVDLCECKFVTWGFWGGNYRTTGNPAGTASTIHLASWVAGEVSQLSQISALKGTASYRGHVFGTVKTGTHPNFRFKNKVHTAAGGFSAAINFDNFNASTGKISDFAGIDYDVKFGGRSANAAGLNKFSGSLSPTTSAPPNTAGSLVGSFMKGGSDPAAGMGGQFKISGDNYLAAGTFIAEK